MEKLLTDKERAERLDALLRGMAETLEQFYDCLRSQQKALLRWDYAAFVSCIQQQNRLVKENLAREALRSALVKEFQAAGPDHPLSLRELGALLGEPWRQRFELLAERIRSASGKVSAMKKQNEALIGKARSLVNDQLKLLLELARINRNLYEESGRKSRKPNLHKVLDWKV